MSEKNIQKAKTALGGMYQNCTFIKNSTINEIDELMRSGNIMEVINLLEQQKNIIGTYHQCYPDYTVDIKTVHGKVIPYSKPLSKESLEKFPPSIKGKFNIPNKYSGFRNFNELLNYSYRTQTNIDINMVELKKMLGNIEDPYQQEIISIADFSTAKWMIKPKEFPEAKPYRITLEDAVESFDYILLRTTKISDNNEIFISNSEQETDIHIELVFNLELNKINFNFKINDKWGRSKNTNLKYLKFIEQAGKGKKLDIISLEEDIVMASGISDDMNYSSGFKSIHEEILFLENIILIEEKYHKIINIPEYISQDDFEAINYLATGIKDGVVKGNWTSYFPEFELTEENIYIWRNIDNNPMELVLKTKMTVIIFDKKFEVPELIRILKSATYYNIDKLIKKMKVLEVGDIIKVKLIPSDDSAFEDILKFEDDFVIVDN